MNRRPRYDTKDHPYFEDGEVVEIDTHYFGVSEEDAEYIEGVIIGYHMNNSVVTNSPDFWIIDFGEKGWMGGGGGYSQEYRAMAVPKYAIVKKEEDLLENGEEDV